MLDLQERLREMHAQQVGNREMARRLGIHHRTVAHHLGLIGLGSVKPGPRSLNIFPDGSAICSKCGEQKLVEQFAMNSSSSCARKPYRLSFCRSCSAAAAKARVYASVERALADRQARLAVRARKLGIRFDLLPGHLLTLWRQQNGLCFYSDAVMSFSDQGASNQVSVDKVVPENGYTVTNVVLCCDRVNTIKSDMTLDEMRQWTPGWHERVVAMWRARGIVVCQVAPGDF